MNRGSDSTIREEIMAAAKRIRKILGRAGCVLLSVVVLAACGGSGGSGSEPVRTFGEIEAMGSIVVNGVKYETEGALIVGLDNPAEDLKPGRVVLVDGRINDDGVTGHAQRIKAEDSVKGPLVGPLLRDDGSVAVGTVLGQTVIFEDNITKFDPGTGLPLGDDINKVFVISGFQRDDGKIQATFAKNIFDDDFSNFTGIYEVKGVIANLDATPGRFNLGALTVDYETAAMRDLPPGGMADGLFVEVKGQTFDAETNTLVATEIEGKSRRMGDDHGRAKAEGFVSDLDLGNKTFTLNRQAVNYAGAAFRGGLEEDLVDGVKVQAQGPLSGGTLNADRVTFKESVRIEAGIQNIQNGNLTFAGLPGITIRVDPDLTRGAEILGSLNSGSAVKVRARQADSGLIATRLEAGSGENDRTIIRGPVTAFDPAVGVRTVTILDTVVVDTKTIENDDFKDHDRVIGPAVFFQALQVGDIVKARFRSGANARWDQIEFQD